MNSGDSGSFNRLSYDTCAYEKNVAESTGPFGYMMYHGKYENCQKCVSDDKNVWRPFDLEIVNRESELKGITRRSTKCPQFKYNPGCNKAGGICTSTFDESNPVVLPGEVCPIVNSGLKKPTNPGYTLKTEPWCDKPKYRYPA